jgi:glyoxylase-like metal-dependent hydrolase (beta-lactamase superfamily II)
MQLTKHGHSCVRFDDGDRSLLIDPGAFSDLDAALDGVGALLVTHEHFDHLNVDRVRAAARADSRLRIWAPAAVAAGALADLGEQVVAVGAGESFEAAGFSVTTFGGQHAVIHPTIPVIANVGYLVDDAVYHPGDSFVVPPVPVSTLLLPSMAPWAKISEVIDFAIAVRAPFAYPIHDFLVKDVYDLILANSLVPIAERFGVQFRAFDDTVAA